MLSNAMNSNTGKIVISVILGLGLAALFRKACEGNNCYVVNSPPKNTVEGKVFQQGGKCFTYNTESSTCDANDSNNANDANNANDSNNANEKTY